MSPPSALKKPGVFQLSPVKTRLVFAPALFASLFFLNGCLSYLWHASSNQIKLISRRMPIEEALARYDFTKEAERNLRMTAELKDFARNRLKMNIDEDVYSTYIHLNRPYVTWLLRVSRADRLEAYTWRFPVVGRVPYKGFFEKGLAEGAAKTFPPRKYDTYVRGVTAYSSLGYIEDSVLSSMLVYSESDFASVIFHELAHTVLFFPDHINFNERFAEFVGRKAAVRFFIAKEGEGSKTARLMQAQWEDELIFSSFMLKEYNALEAWYQENPDAALSEKKRLRLREIQERFAARLLPQMQTNRYHYFPKIRLNNARLLSYRSYNYNMDEFEKLFASADFNIEAFIQKCESFKDAPDPEEALRQAVSAL